MTSEPLGVGVLGVGRWGQNLVRVFREADRSAVVAVCDHDAAKRTAGAPATAYARFGDLLADERIEAVVVATPPESHARFSLEALEAGKHVFVEKPMALSFRDAKRVQAAAARARRCLMVGHLLRYHPAVRRLGELVEEGALGELRWIQAERHDTPGRRRGTPPWWALAPHDISVACGLLGRPVKGVAARLLPVPTGEHEFRARLLVEKSCPVHVHTSFARPRKIRRLTVAGSSATAILDDSTGQTTLTLYPEPLITPGELGFDLDAPLPSLSGEGARRVTFSDEEPLSLEARHFVAAVLDGEHILTNGTEGADVVAVLEAGDTSAREGGVIVPVQSLHAGHGLVEPRA